MAEICIYSKEGCPFCAGALALLAGKKAKVKEIIAADDPDLRAEMIARSGRTSYPQIFIGATHIGGYDDLAACDASGALDALIAR